METEVKNTKSWSQIKDEQFGKKGTERRDRLDRESKRLKNRIKHCEAKKK